MSGILLLHNPDGRPIDPDLLGRLTGSMEYRAPDGTATWHEGPTGLGLTLFRTRTRGEDPAPRITEAPEGLRIVADARLDDRGALVEKLRGVAPGLAVDAPVSELLLAAFRRWGDRCPEHLVGDFAFVIVDPDRNRVFAARDAFGVKPLFETQVDGTRILSNTLSTLLAVPGLSYEPDERSIRDYLIWSGIRDEERTYFQAVRQVRRGSTLNFEAGARRTRTWWELPELPVLRYRRADAYVEHFTSLLHAAVADRLPEGRTVLELSGGLDSGAIACAAAEILDAQGRKGDLHAFTAGYERLFEDPEIPLSKRTAETLGVRHTVTPYDDRALFPRESDVRTASFRVPLEPGFRPEAIEERAAAAWGRVTLTGWDGDALLKAEPRKALLEAFREGRPDRALSDLLELARCGILLRRPMRIGLRNSVRRRVRPRDTPESAAGKWIRPDFAKEVGWPDGSGGDGAPNEGADWRAGARATLKASLWSQLCSSMDPGHTGLLLEPRHPLLDRRLIEFLVHLPAIPWCVEKWIVRAYLRPRLPDAVWRRPKQGLRGDPVLRAWNIAGSGDGRAGLRVPSGSPIRRFVTLEGDLVRQVLDEGLDVHVAVRAYYLQEWLGSITDSTSDRERRRS